MMRFFELYISAIILWGVFYIIGKILFEDKTKNINIKKIITILVFSALLSMLNYVNSEVLHGTLKIICVYSLYCGFYKMIFNKEWSQIIIASLILYLFMCGSEVIIAIIASLFINNNSLAFLKNTIVINILVVALELLMIKIGKRKLVSFVKNSLFEGKFNVIIILIILITTALLGFRIPVANWNFNFEFIITMIILLLFCVIGVFVLKQKSDINKTTSMYQQLVEYSDITNGLLEDYRVVSHEHKNQLLIIRSMIENKDKELNDYVDNLLDKRNDIKYQWVGQLNHLPLSGLKGLINYKLIEMEQNKINTSISISKELSKVKLNNLSTKQKDNLYSIIGIYLDNAIQASKDSKQKEISLEIYKENKEIIIVLANTYKGKIELDKIDEYGYTTKGKNRGIGLHIVNKIIEENKIFMQNRKLFDAYYVQELRINLNDLKNNK